MRLTNKLGLPEAIFEAVKADPYTRGGAEISVTQLIKPPRMVALEREHKDEITEDCADRIWSLLGQAIHTILERAALTAIAERRLFIEVEGWTVSGGMDLYDHAGVLTDYKVTSVYAVKDGLKDEWVHQLNCYAEILRKHGHLVSGLNVICILRDWSKMEAGRDPYYPQAQVIRMEVPLWSSDDAYQYLRERVILHQQARVKLPECSPEDRWARPDVWAVMKVGRKTAVRLYSNEDEARAHVGFDKDLSVVHRPGVSVRCTSYCSVSKFCSQNQALSARPTEDAGDEKTVAKEG